MRKIFHIILFIGLIFVNSGCQEINISIEHNEMEMPIEDTKAASRTGTITPSPAPTRTPYLSTQDSSTSTLDASFDPEDYFFPDDLLPEDISFNISDNETYNVSYLFNPGNLFGAAHRKTYSASVYSLTIEEIIVESTVPVSADNLKVGHHWDKFLLDNSDQALGEYAMVLTSMMHNNAITYHYHFYKGNIVVLLSLGGLDSFVSKENLHMLAKAIEERLPDESPTISRMKAPSLDLHSELFDEYFNDVKLMSCTNPDYPLEAIPVHAEGFCLSTNLKKITNNLKAGIYADNFHEVIYIKELDSQRYLGQQYTELFMPSWCFAWGELPVGDYQALFWIDDQLAKAIPFTLTGGRP